MFLDAILKYSVMQETGIAKKWGKANDSPLKEGEVRQAVNFVLLTVGLYELILFLALLKVIILNPSSSGTKSKLESTLQSFCVL